MISPLVYTRLGLSWRHGPLRVKGKIGLQQKIHQSLYNIARQP
ncbi:hypothetical protein EDWATA_02295 [Edwardsiella tarda ATCC 23685]|uniref:Uncharacterized protein n=1 Tax=Edwardsiella tarda ATCC 23685 TaxID=500638 RepID=D4F6B4_EDWTA|nr:hypothetical protein EDWATA_02295 [Edwardsiella tarda ATCC 23685]